MYNTSFYLFKWKFLEVNCKVKWSIYFKSLYILLKYLNLHTYYMHCVSESAHLLARANTGSY